MGPIVDRSKEHLGGTDKAIVVLRQLLREGIDAVECGEQPRGVEPSTYEKVRPYDGVIAQGKDWRVEFARDLVAKW